MEEAGKIKNNAQGGEKLNSNSILSRARSNSYQVGSARPLSNTEWKLASTQSHEEMKE